MGSVDTELAWVLAEAEVGRVAAWVVDGAPVVEGIVGEEVVEAPPRHTH